VLLEDYFQMARHPGVIVISSLKADLPGLNAPDVHFVLGSLPTDEARPSGDAKINPNL
jgi:hypothetical protein